MNNKSPANSIFDGFKNNAMSKLGVTKLLSQIIYYDFPHARLHLSCTIYIILIIIITIVVVVVVIIHRYRHKIGIPGLMTKNTFRSWWKLQIFLMENNPLPRSFADPERRDGPKKVLRNIIGRCITYIRNIKNLPFSLQITSIKSIINRVDRKMNKKDNENIAIFSIPAKKKKKIWLDSGMHNFKLYFMLIRSIEIKLLCTLSSLMHIFEFELVKIKSQRGTRLTGHIIFSRIDIRYTTIPMIEMQCYRSIILQDNKIII
ncbi:hypothetical protein QTP88_028698 [Uroleucon formosanum]